MRPGITKHGSARDAGPLTLPDSELSAMHRPAPPQARRFSPLADISRLVETPHLAQRVADLTHRRPSGQRRAQRVQHVVFPGRGALDIGQGAAYVSGVPLPPKRSEPLRLLTLDRR